MEWKKGNEIISKIKERNGKNETKQMGGNVRERNGK